MIAVDRHLTARDLSPDQRFVFESLSSWAEIPRGLLTIGGLAGSGKTTLLGIFAATTRLRVAYCAFTGRAASVLTRKLRAAGAPSGLLATTIHRLIYAPIIHPKTERVLGWRRRPALKDEYDLVVIDEASMVSGALLEDLQQYEVPILAVGDHGQLPPVADSGDLMRAPDLKLEAIHRQAAGNPIIQLAHRVRTIGELDGFEDGERVAFGRKSAFEEVYSVAAMGGLIDVGVICWANQTRITLNTRARRCLGFTGLPRKGELVVCLKNEPPIYNGMRGVLSDHTRLGARPWMLESSIAFPEEKVPAFVYQLCAGQFNRKERLEDLDEVRGLGIEADSMKEAGSLFDFGYALTCHKSQGSQWETVVLYLDRPIKPDEEQWRRWAYTAITRASERVVILQ